MGVDGRIVGFHIEDLYIFWYNVNRQNYIFLTRETSENFLHITSRIERKKIRIYLPVNISQRNWGADELKRPVFIELKSYFEHSKFLLTDRPKFHTKGETFERKAGN